MTAQALVHIDGVGKTFYTDDGTVRALDGIDLRVEPGEFVSLVGPSGCGKSTLLNIIGGLLPPTDGDVYLDGTPVTGPPPNVGMMFQNPVLLDWRTARDNVLLPLVLRDGQRAAAAQSGRADELLELVGLAGFEQRYPAQLSGGMQQRVAICRMLIADPALLLMDEPFGALDELTRERMNLELASIVDRTGKATIFVTHNIQEAVFLSDRVFVMSARPGRFAGLVDVTLTRPRELALLDAPEFHALQREARSLLDLGSEPAPAAKGRR